MRHFTRHFFLRTHPAGECVRQVLIPEVLEVDLRQVGVGGDGIVLGLQPPVLHVGVAVTAGRVDLAVAHFVRGGHADADAAGGASLSRI